MNSKIIKNDEKVFIVKAKNGIKVTIHKVDRLDNI